MEGLLTLLVIAGLFYFMMRAGCGSHAVHGHRGGQDEHAGHGSRSGPDAPAGNGEHADHQQRADVGGARAIDPVCGMDVAPGEGHTKMHAGREYRLCSRVCLDKFDANPDQYASVQGGAR